MAFFGVTIEKISKVINHPNPEVKFLDLASVEGMSFQFVMGRDSVKVGDYVIYFPIDSVLPQFVLNVLPEVIVKKLAGSGHNRVKTVKLKGAVAQGLAIEINDFPLEQFGIILGEWKPQYVCYDDVSEAKLESTIDYNGMLLPKDITRYVGVEKYEPPVVNMGNCQLHRLPSCSPYFDIEGADRNQHIVDYLIEKDIDIVITEKVEGTNHSIVVEIPDYNMRVCQRSGEVILGDEKAVSMYHEGAKRCYLPEKTHKIAQEVEKTVTVRSELVGPSIQSNIYQFKALETMSFEICLEGAPMNWVEEKALMEKMKIKSVPVLFVGKLNDFLAGRTIQEASNGKSVINPNVLREGIVIRPTEELPEYPGYGRVIIKQRSPEYLAKYDH